MITSAEVRTRVTTLPSLPTSVVALGEAIADDRCTADRVLAVLAKDPPLSAAMLRLANSVAFCGLQPVTDLRAAVLRLGYDALLSLGRTAAIIRTFRGGNTLDPLRLWQHSVAVGLTAKAICRMLRRRHLEETAFLAGLLHDIGKIALDRCFQEDYAPVLAAVREGTPFLEAERRALGLTHAEVGAEVGLSWNFGESLVEAIRLHHAPPAGTFLPNLLELCDLLVRTRIPNGPADEVLAFVLHEHRAFGEVFGSLPAEELDVERLTFGIDEELEHAVTFVQLAFQE